MEKNKFLFQEAMPKSFQQELLTCLVPWSLGNLKKVRIRKRLWMICGFIMRRF